MVRPPPSQSPPNPPHSRRAPCGLRQQGSSRWVATSRVPAGGGCSQGGLLAPPGARRAARALTVRRDARDPRDPRAASAAAQRVCVRVRAVRSVVPLWAGRGTASRLAARRARARNCRARNRRHASGRARPGGRVGTGRAGARALCGRGQPAASAAFAALWFSLAVACRPLHWLGSTRAALRPLPCLTCLRPASACSPRRSTRSRISSSPPGGRMPSVSGPARLAAMPGDIVPL